MDIGDLKEHIERIFKEKDKALDAALIAQKEATSAALASAKEAVLVAQANSDRWRADANEWRQTMNDKDNRFLTTAYKDAVDKELESFRQFKESMSGVISEISNLREKVGDLWDWRNTMKGVASQSDVNRITILATISGIGGVLGIVLAVISILAK
jgi:hypothetical protein